MSEIYTNDAFLDGRVRVFQPRKGFRAGTDSVLLAAAIDPDLTGRALEIGCGAGGALLPACACLPGLSFTGLERDASMASLARRGVAENDIGGRVEIVDGDKTCSIVFFLTPHFLALDRSSRRAKERAPHTLKACL